MLTNGLASCHGLSTGPWDPSRLWHDCTPFPAPTLCQGRCGQKRAQGQPSASSTLASVDWVVGLLGLMLPDKPEETRGNRPARGSKRPKVPPLCRVPRVRAQWGCGLMSSGGSDNGCVWGERKHPGVQQASHVPTGEEQAGGAEATCPPPELSREQVKMAPEGTPVELRCWASEEADAEPTCSQGKPSPAQAPPPGGVWGEPTGGVGETSWGCGETVSTTPSFSLQLHPRQEQGPWQSNGFISQSWGA